MCGFIKSACILICCFFTCNLFNYVKADVVFVSLKDDNNFLQSLKNYGIHQEICDQYIDRYTIIKNIEYYDFAGNLIKNGAIVVQDALAENVAKIFEELKNIKFPVAPINPIIGRKIVNVLPFGLFGWKKAIDDKSIDNLTGAYCCREIEHTNRLSLHSFGTAIDLNTLQNPCIFIDEKTNEIQNIVPEKGAMYLNRSFNRKGKVEKDIGKINDKIVKIFKKYGYDIWGGHWDFPIDYQHFQVSTRKFADLLMYADKEDAKSIFKIHTNCVNLLDKSITEMAEEKNIDLLDKYKQNKDEFFKEVGNWCILHSQKDENKDTKIKNKKR